jgi:uncharacterized protein (DUF1499 family)
MNKIITPILLIVMLGYLASCGTPKGLGISDQGALKSVPKSPNCISSQADPTDKIHYMAPWSFEDKDSAKTKIEKIITDFGATKVVSNTENYIHAVFTTGWMKYRDDVEFFFENDTKLIHFRSASRIGYGDNGVNYKRMKKLKGMYLAD